MGWDWLNFWGVIVVVLSTVVCLPYLMNIARIFQELEDNHVTQAIERYNSRVKEDT